MKNPILILKSIFQRVAAETSSQKQMELIVSAVHDAMRVAVCSLYINYQDELVLVATQGLDPSAVGHVRLQIGEGLVGATAKSRHPINVEDATTRPEYRYFPETHEELYHGFLSVPIIHLRRLVGVLVVEEEQARKFTGDDEAFLITVASQLAMIIAQLDWDALRPDLDLMRMYRVTGIKGAPGIGIGEVRIVEDAGLKKIPDRKITNIEAELAAFRTALDLTQEQLAATESAMTSTLPHDIAAIFSVYRMLLEGGDLANDIEEHIKSGNWAPGAIRHVINKFVNVFEDMDDPYLKARSEDIRSLGNKLYTNLHLKQAQPSEISADLVLAGELISITEFAKYRPEQLAGIICYGGSSLSHTAVLANALGIPAVMGTGEIKGLSDGTAAIVDGHQAQIILNPADAVVQEFAALREQDRSLNDLLEHLRDEPAMTQDQVHIHLYTNTGLLADISPGLARGAEGVGLYRSEIPFMVHENFPTEDEQYDNYRHILSSYHGKPVYIRTLDIGGDKPLPYFPFEEENPALGWRGIRFTLDNSSIFMSQIRAMLRAAEGYNNLNILLPMVSRVDEIDSFIQLLDDAMDQLKTEGRDILRPRVGIMLEVPGSISLLPFYAKRIDFISIGSNDLSQYLLAVDRNNPRVSPMYDHLHPSVLHEVNRIVIDAQRFGLEVSLCGQMASDPMAVVFLIGMGIRTLSVSAFNLPKIKWLIRSISYKKAQELLGEAMLMENEQMIRARVTQYLHAVGLDALVNRSGQAPAPIPRVGPASVN
jgi:phosphotransferase system enzyme I (PtsI)/phosphotransferase system enzyme I (PtsP)